MWIVVAIAWAALLAYLWLHARGRRRSIRELPDRAAHLQWDWIENTIEIEIVGFGDVAVATNHLAHSFLFRVPPYSEIVAMPEGKDMVAVFGQPTTDTVVLPARSRQGMYSSLPWGVPPRVNRRAHHVLHRLGWSPYWWDLTAVPKWHPWRIAACHTLAVIPVVISAVVPGAWIAGLIALHVCAKQSHRTLFQFVTQAQNWK